IKISITETSTFEKELIENNKTDKCKNYILNAIKLTRPINGKKYSSKFATLDLDVNECFELIETVDAKGKTKSHKAEFAMDLRSVLEAESANFNIPKYIKDGFDELMR
ncbi:MAG TPA: hypothetical protein PKY82_16895, partial [Pyrinomonadaceae bacterium]|nr:hypothetical protein [Pyrinomonadaceae bacterium]